MDLPALAATQNSPNLGNTLLAAAQIKNAGLQNRLIQSKLERENQLTTLRGQIMGGGQGNGVGDETAGADAMPSSGGTGQQDDLLKRYLAIDPAGGKQIIDGLDSLDARQRKQTKDKNDEVVRTILGIESLPPEQRPMAYAQTVGQMGSQFKSPPPPQYDPAWMQQKLFQHLAVDKAIEMKNAQSMKQSDLVKVYKNGKPTFVKASDAVGQQAYEKPDETLVEIADPTSPTGTRYVPRGQAAGQPGKSIQATTGQVPKATQGKIGEKQFVATEGLARLKEVQAAFDPKFLQLGTRLQMAGKDLKDFVGMNLDPADKQELTDYSVFRRRSIDNVNRLLNELSGAAVSPQEAERLKASQPNAGSGIFDGDAPTNFKAKMDDTIKQSRNAILRYSYALSNGMNPLKTGVELADVPKLVEKRGGEIEKEIKTAMPTATADQIRMEVKARLAKEFGMQ